MSSSRVPKGTDTTTWILSGAIVVLTAVDLLVWAAIQNGYNPAERFTPAIAKSASTDIH